MAPTLGETEEGGGGEGAGGGGDGGDGDGGGGGGGGAMQTVVVPETPVRVVAKVHTEALLMYRLAPPRVAMLS